MGHKARNRKKYQQRIKTSIDGIDPIENGSANEGPNFGRGTPSRPYTSSLDPSLSPNSVMQPNPCPINAPPTNMIQPVFQLGLQDRHLLLRKGPMGGIMDPVLGMNRPIGMGYAAGGPNYHTPIRDPSEFPSLTSLNLSLNEVGLDSLESNPFEMLSDEFPALPGAAVLPLNEEASARPKTMSIVPPAIPQPCSESSEARNYSIPQKSTDVKPEIITSMDGKVINIPKNMINDQFGMVGLLTRFRAAETKPDLVSLAVGTDLTKMGLNLNDSENLYSNFGGPWAESSVPVADMEFPIPSEYKVSEQLRHPDFVQRAPVRFARYGEDELFYMFYNFCGEILQMQAAAELYKRDWRYHKEEKIWITRIPEVQVVEKQPKYEVGTYYFFNPISWTKIAKKMLIEYDKLEGRPVDTPCLNSGQIA